MKLLKPLNDAIKINNQFNCKFQRALVLSTKQLPSSFFFLLSIVKLHLEKFFKLLAALNIH